jgi:hypothetical protein
MKQLITKSDGKPTKSKVFAKQFLEEKGIDESCLIEENGQFFYEEEEEKEVDCRVADAPRNDKACLLPVNWETPVFNKDNERTKLIVPGSDVEAVIIAKHPAGQLRNNSCFELAIGQENFIMSLELISKIFRVKGVK